MPDSLKEMTQGELAHCAFAPLYSLAVSRVDPNPTWVRTYPLVPASLKKDDPW